VGLGDEAEQVTSSPGWGDVAISGAAAPAAAAGDEI